MAGTESLDRNLEAEDEAVRRNIERCEAELHDGSQTSGMADLSKQAEGDGMRIMAARDVYVNSPPLPTPPSAPKPTPQPTTPQPDARVFAGVGTEGGPGLVSTTDSAPTAADAPPAAPTSAPADTPLWKKAVMWTAIVASTGSLPLAGVGLHSMFVAPTPAVTRPVVKEPAEPVQVPVQTSVPPSLSVKVNKRAATTP